MLLILALKVPLSAQDTFEWSEVMFIKIFRPKELSDCAAIIRERVSTLQMSTRRLQEKLQSIRDLCI